MSKAFTKDDAPSDDLVVPPRAPLPEGVPNYVTARGLRLLHEEVAELERERQRLESGLRDAAERRRATALVVARAAAAAQRLATAEMIASDPSPEAARFGTAVTVRDGGGTTRYRIVGVDEADPARGDLAFTSPIARALLGKEAGDEAIVKTPQGERALEIVAVEPDRDA